MRPAVKAIFILLVFDIYSVFSVSCQNDGNKDVDQNYDLVKLFRNYAEHIKTSRNLKLVSETNRKILNELENLLSISINSTLLDIFSESTSNKCIEDLKYVFESVTSLGGGWAVKMLDSYGKPESGILMGNLKWLGQYDECIHVQAPPQKDTIKGNFRGKYCTLQIPVKLGSASFPMSTALCLPDSCNPNGTIFSILPNFNINGSAAVLVEELESLLSNATLTCKPTSRKLTAGAIVVICFLSILAILAIIGSSITAFENYMKRKLSENCKCGASDLGKPVNSDAAENTSQREGDDVILVGTQEKIVLPACLEKSKAFFNCFCVFTNGEKIVNIASAEGQLPSLHGIRFLSMTWVILCHTYQTSTILVNNSADILEYTDNWTFQIILNGFFCVDSFFLLSGFLVAYLFFQQAQKTDGKIPWLYFYIHRYIRLTPVYMIALAFYATVYPFLGSGPLWPDYTVDEVCKEKWWWNALYINNFLSKECMGWSWYLANDMQFYVITPLFLITLWRWPKAGYSLLGLFFWIHFVSNFVLTYDYNLMAGVGDFLMNEKDPLNLGTRVDDYLRLVYTKPWTRMGPYLVGLALGYYVYRRKLSNVSNLNWQKLSAGWLVAAAIALSCQFGLYHQNLNTIAASFYNALSRVGFALGLGWIIFVCVIGQGGVVNSILSCKFLIPLSRLSYCAYLVHPIVLTAYTFSVKTLITASHVNVIMLYLGVLVISYAVAFVTSLLLESPVIRLERLIRNKLAAS